MLRQTQVRTDNVAGFLLTKIMEPTKDQIESALRYDNGTATCQEVTMLGNYSKYVCQLDFDASTGARKILAFACRQSAVEIEELQDQIKQLQIEK